MQSKASTVEEYFASLPADRREALLALRQVIRKNLDPVYIEEMGYGMPGWSVPHSVYPAGYHCNPKIALPYAGMASQKNYMSLYLMFIYGDGNSEMLDWFVREWKKTGKKLDMGKSCIRFKKLEDLALDVIGEAIRRTPARKWIEMYETSFLRGKDAKPSTRSRKARSAASGKKPARKSRKRT
ncbi:DUF1801 domain-containing protein [bacterium]|nr:MAG: DUF1801 domain-containing protein [bacterium]RIK59729.1 MAG: DUF1801 domain-containing protein [Planctomycetota bacterium]